jgi:hypothetical protein
MPRSRRAVTVLVAIAAMAAAVSLPSGQSGADPTGREIIVISDLHLGIGHDGELWHAYEDFRWREEFLAFLQAIDRQGSGTDLVINGDLLDLQQSVTVPCSHAQRDVGCTEAEALARAERVISAHRDELRAIGHFAASGSNRVYLTAGDHDAALFFPAVRERVLTAIAAPAGRLEFAASGGWRSADGRVYAEHGHQLPGSPHRFDRWPDPFVPVGDRVHLERPWGARTIQAFFDRAEGRFPIVDNIAAYGAGAKYALAAVGATGPEDVPALLRYLLAIPTWQQFRMDLDEGDVQAPEWDVELIRRDMTAFLTASIPRDDPLAPHVARAAADDRLLLLDPPLSEEDIIAICDYRAATRRARRRMERVLTQLSGVGPPVAECPRLAHTVGSEFEYYWRSRDRLFSRHIQATTSRLHDGRSAPPFEIFVYGHTHLAERAFRPGGDAGPLVVGSGAWQRTIHPVELDQRVNQNTGGVAAALAELSPETLSPCYSFLRIAPSGGAIVAEARVWRRASNDAWEIASSCGS